MGRLPASLTHLVLGNLNQLLLPDVLPAGLRRMHMGGYNQRLSPGVLPLQLQQLDLASEYDHSITHGSIPSSVTHLRLSRHFDYPLQFGIIPHDIVHLNFGAALINLCLLVSCLPATLRELVIGKGFSQELQPGSLPDGLQVLAFVDNFLRCSASRRHPCKCGSCEYGEM